MATPFAYVIAATLALHGLVHLVGTAVYLELAEVAGLTFKTTLLGGRLDLGTAGIRVVGVLWAVAAVGFLAAAVAFLADWTAWRTLLLAVAVFSLVLTGLDYSVAYAGVVVNLAVLAWLFLGAPT